MMIAWHGALLAIASVVGALALGSAAPVNAQSAEGLHIYPATNCQVWGPDLRLQRDRSAAYSQVGRVANRSNVHSLNLVCPIERNVIENTGLGFVDVHFLDRHPLIDLSCTIYNVDLNGETVYDSQTLSHSGASDLFQTLKFFGLTAVDPSMYVLFCTIPPRVGSDDFSWISAYVVQETF